MISYDFECENCGVMELQFDPKEVKSKMICPECGGNMKMIFSPTPDVWHTRGSFKDSKC